MDSGNFEQNQELNTKKCQKVKDPPKVKSKREQSKQEKPVQIPEEYKAQYSTLLSKMKCSLGSKRNQNKVECT